MQPHSARSTPLVVGNISLSFKVYVSQSQNCAIQPKNSVIQSQNMCIPMEIYILLGPIICTYMYIDSHT